MRRKKIETDEELYDVAGRIGKKDMSSFEKINELIDEMEMPDEEFEELQDMILKACESSQNPEIQELVELGKADRELRRGMR